MPRFTPRAHASPASPETKTSGDPEVNWPMNLIESVAGDCVGRGSCGLYSSSSSDSKAYRGGTVSARGSKS